LEDLGVDGKILDWIVGTMMGEGGLDATGSGKGPIVGSCEHDDETWGYIKGGEFLD
jgi:hypothetical protein